MKCRKCKTELSSSEKFCSQCGERAVEVKQKRKAPKKFLIISFGMLTAVCIAFFMWGNNASNPQKVIASFERALIDEDLETLAVLIHSSSSELNVEKSDLEDIAAQMNEYPNYREEVLADLKEEAAEAEFNQMGSNEDSGVHLFVLTNGPKKFGLFDQFYITMPGFYLDLTTNMEGASIFVNEELAGEYTAEEPLIYGPVHPGEYEVTASFEGEFAKIEESNTVQLYDSYETTIEESVYLEGGSTRVVVEESWVEDHALPVTVLIDGEPTEMDLEDGGLIEPIALDGTHEIKAQAEAPWGIIETSPTTIDSSSTYLSFSEIESDLQEELAALSLDFMLASFEGKELDMVTPNLKEKIEAEIALSENEDIDYKSSMNAFSYDSEGFFIEEDGETDQLVMIGQTKMSYDGAYTYEGEEEVETYSDGMDFWYSYDKDKDTWIISGYLLNNYSSLSSPTEIFEETNL